MPATYTVARPLKRAPTRPGELMREILKDHVRLGVSEAARRMQVSRQSLHAVLKGERVTAEMAVRFGKLVGGDPMLYVRMQANYDLWQAQTKLKDELRAIETADVAA